jgi:hypothetical protein
MLINNQYIKQGRIDPNELFVRHDVSEEIKPYVAGVRENLESMLDVLRRKTCPEIRIGPPCEDPYPCALKDVCWGFLPEESVFILNRIRKEKAFGFLEKNVTAIADIPDGISLTASQEIQRECHRTAKPFINAPAIKDFLNGLEFPVHFLDFETVNPAIPFYDRSRPYQNIPFQFSLHVLPGWGKMPDHHSFLAEGTGDPRPEILERLRDRIEDKGSIVSYNMNFELTRLGECVETFPAYQGWFQKIEKRFSDLIVPFRSFDYYDPRQMGRTSIKKVFPALTGGSYDGMDIADGSTASMAFARITFNDRVPGEEKRQVRESLEAYCRLDTQAMVDILNVLKAL